MKFIDFFAGIGGFRKGMELAGHKCIGFCEFDKFATASYISMHLLTDEQRKALEDIPIKQRQKEILKEEYRNGEWYANDIRRVYAGDIPRADCWCFGFPCQDISVAGKQVGFQGNRSSLFFRVMYLVGQLEEENKPTYLFIENVKNLLSVNGGWDFARLLIEMEREGYDAEWQVLNSKDYEVPQNRERCFIIGHLRGRSTSKIFPIEGTDGENSVQIIAHKDGYRRNTQVFSPDGITETLDTGQGGGRGHHVALQCFIDLSYQESKSTDIARCLKARYDNGVSNLRADKSSVAVKIMNKDYRYKHEAIHDTSGCGSTLMARDYKDAQRVAIPVLTPDRAEKRQNGRRFKDNGEPMFTLTNQDRHGVAIEPTGFNCMPDGTCRTLKNQYQKNSGVNFACQTDRGATAVAVKFKNITASTIRKVAPRNKVSILRGQSQENNLDICVKVAEATKQGYSECRVGVDAVNLSVRGSKTRRGRVGKEIANTLDTSCNQGIFVQVSEELVVYAVWYEKYQCYIAIRKLTPKECFRLQGWSDDYFDKAQFVNSDSQLYKQAGNGVTVTVIETIARKMNVNLN